MPQAFVAKGYEHPELGTIADLPVVRGIDGALYSAWLPSWREWWRVLLGAPVVIGVLQQRQPPIMVEVGVERIPL